MDSGRKDSGRISNSANPESSRMDSGRKESSTGSARRIYTLLILRLSAVVFVVFSSNFWQHGRRLLSIIWSISQLSYQLHPHYGCDKEATP
jgi:hypothetical protein